jgi:hypothetical protein
MLFIIGDNSESREARLPRLETIRKAAVKLSDELTKDYIWQREPFKLGAKIENGESPRPTTCGDGNVNYPMQDWFTYAVPPTMETTSRMNG